MNITRNIALAVDNNYRLSIAGHMDDVIYYVIHYDIKEKIYNAVYFSIVEAIWYSIGKINRNITNKDSWNEY